MCLFNQKILEVDRFLIGFYWPPNSSMTSFSRGYMHSKTTVGILAGRRDGDLPDANKVIRVTGK